MCTCYGRINVHNIYILKSKGIIINILIMKQIKTIRNRYVIGLLFVYSFIHSLITVLKLLIVADEFCFRLTTILKVQQHWLSGAIIIILCTIATECTIQFFFNFNLSTKISILL